MGLILGKFSCGEYKSQTDDYTNINNEIIVEQLNERFKRYNSTSYSRRNH